jgi:hypothetical protein
MYVLIGIFIAGLALGGLASWKVTADSYKADLVDERNEKIKEQQQIAVEVAASVKRVQEFRDEQEKNLSEVINAKDKAIEDLQKRERDARVANRGLFVSARACASSHGMPAEAESPEVANSGPDRVRLSSEDEQHIRADYGDAQRVVIQYNACRDKLKELVTVEE